MLTEETDYTDSLLDYAHEQCVVADALALMAEYIIHDAPGGNNIHRPLSMLLPAIKQMQTMAHVSFEALKLEIAEQKANPEPEAAAEVEAPPPVDAEEAHTLPYGIKEIPEIPEIPETPEAHSPSAKDESDDEPAAQPDESHEPHVPEDYPF